MKKEEIHPWDWHRILFGEAPTSFMLEVFMRTFLIYIALLIVVRIMGKRMGGQLTISELAVMVTLGAIVSPAMQIPQLGLLMGIMILICALIFQKGINLSEFKSDKFEELSQGTVSTLVDNGIIQLGAMRDSKISRQQLYSALRNEKIYNLGDVNRVYFEACGKFSIYKKSELAVGLSIFPPKDQGINYFSQQAHPNEIACTKCGNVVSKNLQNRPCSECGANEWTFAVKSI